MENCDLIILVFSCYTIPKYADQIETINSTWAKKCEEINKNIKILYFVGEEKNPHFNDTQLIKYINLPGVKDDYLSASYKQFIGMKYIYENYTTKFIISIGTDTYLNIPKLLSYISNFDHTDCLYIGGHGCHREIGMKIYYYHSGGPGFIITYNVLKKIYHLLENLMEHWINLCNVNNKTDLITACDFAISYYLQQPDMNVEIIKAPLSFFRHCNYYNFPCNHEEALDISEIISCHCMNENDFYNFTNILNNNNHFL